MGEMASGREVTATRGSNPMAERCWSCVDDAIVLQILALPDGVDAEVAEGFEVWEWDAADGACAVEAFWAEV
jgi:hypothetical protein